MLDPPIPFTSPFIRCPSCYHGIDPHGTDPGGQCGVGMYDADTKTNTLCPCMWSPNDIAALLIADTIKQIEMEEIGDVIDRYKARVHSDMKHQVAILVRNNLYKFRQLIKALHDESHKNYMIALDHGRGPQIQLHSDMRAAYSRVLELIDAERVEMSDEWFNAYWGHIDDTRADERARVVGRLQALTPDDAGKVYLHNVLDLLQYDDNE